MENINLGAIYTYIESARGFRSFFESTARKSRPGVRLRGVRLLTLPRAMTALFESGSCTGSYKTNQATKSGADKLITLPNESRGKSGAECR